MRLTFVLLLKAVAATFEPLNLPVTRGSKSKRIRYNAETKSPQSSSRHCPYYVVNARRFRVLSRLPRWNAALMASGEPSSNISPLD